MYNMGVFLPRTMRGFLASLNDTFPISLLPESRTQRRKEARWRGDIPLRFRPPPPLKERRNFGLAIDKLLATTMPRIPVLIRRVLFDQAESTENGVWICEMCGDADEEGLVVYDADRITRNYPDGRCVCLCPTCADRIPHGRVLSS